MKIIFQFISLITLNFFIIPVSFASVPAGFSDLIEEKNARLNLFLTTEKEDGIYANFLVSGDKVTLPHHDSEKVKIYLTENGVEETIATKIVDALLSSYQSSLLCLGFRDSCTIEPDEFAAVYIPDTNKLRLFVNPKLMDSGSLKIDSDYVDNKIGKNAFITQHQFNTNYNRSESGQANTYYNYYNESYLGLKNGYIHTDISYDNSDNKVEVQEATYNYLQEDKRLRFGFIFGDNSWNNTSVLDVNNTLVGYVVSFGNTSQLNKTDVSEYNRIYFSTPVSGRVQVTREDNGRLILNKNVSVGQNYITYAELPKGVYTAKIVVFSGDTTFYQETKQIFNNNNYNDTTLNYYFTAGQFSDAYITSDQDSLDADLITVDKATFNGDTFVQSKIAKTLFNQLTVGLGFITTKSDFQSKLAINYDFNSLSSVSSIYSIFNDGTYTTNINVRYDKLNVSVATNVLSSNTDEYRLSNYFYGYNDNQLLTLSYNQYLFEHGMLFVSAMHNNYTDNRYSHDSTQKSVELGYSFDSYFDSKIDLSYRYNKNEASDFNDNDTLVSINVSIPFGKSNQYNYSHYTSSRSNDSGLSHTDNLNIGLLATENTSLVADVGTDYTTNTKASASNNAITKASVSLNNSNKYVTSSAYGYANSDNSMSGSLQLKSNNIITNDNFYFAENFASSYFISQNESSLNASIEAQNVDFLSVVQTKKNDKDDKYIPLTENIVLYALDEYKEYEFLVDGAASDFYNNGESYTKASSYPGSVITLAPDLHEVKSFISVFSDIEGKAVTNISCQGFGCISVDELSAGVYQFKVIPSLPYQLLSQEKHCVIPNLSSAEDLNLGDNFCMPPLEIDQKSGFTVATLDNGVIYYYVGKFSDDFILGKYKNQIESKEVSIVEKVVGDYTFVFAKTALALDASLLNSLNELSAYAVEDVGTSPYAAR